MSIAEPERNALHSSLSDAFLARKSIRRRIELPLSAWVPYSRRCARARLLRAMAYGSSVGSRYFFRVAATVCGALPPCVYGASADGKVVEWKVRCGLPEGQRCRDARRARTSHAAALLV